MAISNQLNRNRENPEKIQEIKLIEDFVKQNELWEQIKDINTFSQERRERTAEAIRVANHNKREVNIIFANYLLLSRNKIEKAISTLNHEEKNIFFRNELWGLDEIMELPTEEKNEALKLMLVDGRNSEEAYARAKSKVELDKLIEEVIRKDLEENPPQEEPQWIDPLFQ